MDLSKYENSTWMGDADPRRREAFERAITVSGAGSVLLQTFINRVVQNLTLREFGMQAALDRRPGSGDKAYVNRRTTGSTVGGTWVADTVDANTLVSQGSYAQTNFTYRTLLTRGQVTRKIQATGASYGDVLATAITMKAEDFANSLETSLVYGDTEDVAVQINGLLTLVSAVSAQCILNTTAASGGDALSLAQLDTAIDTVKGSANRSDLVIVGSYRGIRELNAKLQAQQRFNDMTEISAGFQVRTYDGIPLVVSTGMPDTLEASATTGQIQTYSAVDTTTALAVINKRYMWIEELTPTTVMPLAKDTSQYDKFDMFWDGALVWANTKGAALLTNIRAG